MSPAWACSCFSVRPVRVMTQKTKPFSAPPVTAVAAPDGDDHVELSSKTMVPFGFTFAVRVACWRLTACSGSPADMAPALSISEIDTDLLLVRPPGFEGVTPIGVELDGAL